MKRSILLLLFVVAIAQAAPTQIRDTGYTAFGGMLFSGRITVTAPDMTTQDGRTVNRWEQSYTITGGILSVDLEPNDTATPAGTSYLVIYRPRSGQAWSERWVVPTSATPLRVNQVRVLNAPVPTVMIQPQQIQSGGATAGQALLWNGNRYAPGNILTSTAWGGISGSLANQTDLINALAAKAALSHVHLIADVTGLQTALDAKTTGSGTTGTVPIWSSAHELADSVITSDFSQQYQTFTTITMPTNPPHTSHTPAKIEFSTITFSPSNSDSFVKVAPEQSTGSHLYFQFLDTTGNAQSSITGPDSSGKYTLSGFNISLPPLMLKQTCDPGYGSGSISGLISHTVQSCPNSTVYSGIGTYQYLFSIAQIGNAIVTITVNWTERQPYGVNSTPRSQVLGTLDASTLDGPLFGSIFMQRQSGTPITLTGSTSPSGTTGMWFASSYFAY